MGFINRIIIVLVISGLVCSWGAWIVIAQSTGGIAGKAFFEPRSKPILYYALHGIGMCGLIGAGVFAGIKGGHKRLNRHTRAAFWILQISSLTWAFIAYDLNDFLSWKALGSTGPMVWLSCVLIFAGMDNSIWRLLAPVIRFIAYITAGLALFEMISTHFIIEKRWFSSHVRYMVLLMWFGGWTFLTIGSCAGWRIILRCYPYVVFIFSCILTQTRSWLLMSIFLLFSLFFVTKRFELNWTKIIVNFIVIFNILVIVFLSVSLFARQPVLDSLSELKARISTDSRTRQYVDFFSQVPPSDLILGKGPTATYVSGGKSDYQFFDNAYIWMAFIGGLPILVSYFVIVILPGIKVILRGGREDDAAAAILIALWGIACAGLSTYSLPSVSPYCYLLYLLAGRCLGYLADIRQAGTYRTIYNYPKGLLRQKQQVDI